jgi:isochorismate hydrolase
MCDVVKAIELDGDTTVIERLPEFFEEDKESMLRSRRRRRKRLIFCGVVIGIGLIVLAISSVIVLLSVMLTRNMEEERPDTNVSNNL